MDKKSVVARQSTSRNPLWTTPPEVQTTTRSSRTINRRAKGQSQRDSMTPLIVKGAPTSLRRTDSNHQETARPKGVKRSRLLNTANASPLVSLGSLPRFDGSAGTPRPGVSKEEIPLYEAPSVRRVRLRDTDEVAQDAQGGTHRTSDAADHPAPLGLNRPDGAGPSPVPMVLTRAPLGAAQAGIGSLPQQIARAQATRHLQLMTGTTKATVYATWAASQGGRAAGSLASLGSLGEIAAPFAFLGVVCSLYDAVTTHTDKVVAEADYLSALAVLSQQKQALALKLLQPHLDPQVKAVLECNIGALEAFVAGYEGAYVSPSLRVQIKSARAAVQPMLDEIVTLYTESESLVEELKQVPAPTSERCAQIDDRLNEIEKAINGLQIEAEARLSRDGMKRVAVRALQDAQNDPDASEETVASRKADVEAFRADVLQTVFHPFKDSGANQLKYLRDVILQPNKGALDATTTTLGLVTALEVINVFTSAIGLGMASSLLGVAMARADVVDGQREQVKATNAKVAALSQVAFIGQIHSTLSESRQPEVRACKPLAFSLMRCAGRTLREKHRATNYNQIRAGKGTASTHVGVLSMVAGGVAIGLSNPITAIPTAVAGATVGLGWTTALAVNAGMSKSVKDALKVRQAAAKLFVQHMTLEGIGQLYLDHEGLSSSHQAVAVNQWAKELDALCSRLKREGVDDVVLRQLSVERLLENEYLAIESLTHILHERARPGGAQRHPNEAQLVSMIAAHANKTDPDTLPMAGYPSPADHQAAVRQRLCELFGVKDYKDAQLPLPDAPTNDKEKQAQAKQITVDVVRLLSTNMPGMRGFMGLAQRLLKGEALSTEERAHGHEVALGIGRHLASSHGWGPAELLDAQEVLIQSMREQSDDLEFRNALKAAPELLHALELLVHPDWLAPVQPAQALAGFGNDKGKSKAALALSKLVLATKTAGREQRDGATPEALPTDTRTRTRTAHERSVSSGGTRSKVIRRVSKGVQRIRRRSLLLKQRATSLTPNPMGTPADAARQLNHHADNANHVASTAERLLRHWMRQLHGGDGLTIKPDPALMEKLPPESNRRNTVRFQADPLVMAHVKALLGEVRAAATASAQAMAEGQKDHHGHSASVEAMRTYMTGISDLCRELEAAIEKHPTILSDFKIDDGLSGADESDVAPSEGSDDDLIVGLGSSLSS